MNYDERDVLMIVAAEDGTIEIATLEGVALLTIEHDFHGNSAMADLDADAARRLGEALLAVATRMEGA